MTSVVVCVQLVPKISPYNKHTSCNSLKYMDGAISCVSYMPHLMWVLLFATSVKTLLNLTGETLVNLHCYLPYLPVWRLRSKSQDHLPPTCHINSVHNISMPVHVVKKHWYTHLITPWVRLYIVSGSGHLHAINSFASFVYISFIFIDIDIFCCSSLNYTY